HVKATPAATFEALLETLGPGMLGAENKPMPMKIEAWPGGRWFRDLGDGNGHLWAHVQAIKRPTLLEFCGPLMMSLAVASNVQYRLSPAPDGTLIQFHHYALGALPADFRTGMEGGWHEFMQRIKQRAEKAGK
ncbi:MAG: SRPBCC family protein, partial [Terriglobales bacterium]